MERTKMSQVGKPKEIKVVTPNEEPVPQKVPATPAPTPEPVKEPA